jgi:hypothetical protein
MRQFRIWKVTEKSLQSNRPGEPVRLQKEINDFVSRVKSPWWADFRDDFVVVSYECDREIPVNQNATTANKTVRKKSRTR